MMTDGGRVRVATWPRLRQSVTGDTVNRNRDCSGKHVTSSAAGAVWTQEVVCALKGACCSSVDDVVSTFCL